MDWKTDRNILIVGLGLIGGSYAQGLAQAGYHLMAIDQDMNSIDFALIHGMIEEGAGYSCEEIISKADVIVFALYPHLICDWIKDNQHLFKSGLIITDVTGVKSAVVYDAQKILRPDVEFIAAHPMAGKEVSGVFNSDCSIFRNANYIVTPTDKNTPEAIEWCKELGRILGFSRISVLSPEEHDSMIGYVSQLTHCIAVALMNCNDNPCIVDYTGDSFRDLTRIANINEKMWSELFFMNKNPLLEQMDLFINEMQILRSMLENNDKDGLCEKMRLSTKRRSLFNKK